MKKDATPFKSAIDLTDSEFVLNASNQFVC